MRGLLRVWRDDSKAKGTFKYLYLRETQLFFIAEQSLTDLRHKNLLSFRRTRQ